MNITDKDRQNEKYYKIFRKQLKLKENNPI